MVCSVFGMVGEEIPNGYYYINVFLYNCDYYCIHALVSGIIIKIERILGELMFLCLWFYPIVLSKSVFVNVRWLTMLWSAYLICLYCIW